MDDEEVVLEGDGLVEAGTGCTATGWTTTGATEAGLTVAG